MLRSRAYAQAFQEVNREFDERHKADFPYVPDSLYFFIADPIEVAIDDTGE